MEFSRAVFPRGFVCPASATAAITSVPRRLKMLGPTCRTIVVDYN
jgi:hypothetical protein